MVKCKCGRNFINGMGIDLHVADGECESSTLPICSSAKNAAKEIYKKLDDLEMEAGQASMYAQDCRVGDKLRIKSVADIIDKHCR